MNLSKDEQTLRDHHVEQLRLARGKLEDAINVANEKLQAIRDELTSAQEAYNEVVQAAADWADDIANVAEATIDDRSEKWQESERGQAAIAWKDVWRDLDLSPADITMPEDAMLDGDDPADTLENAPAEMEEV